MASATGNMRSVPTDADFHTELANAGSKLVVVDFHATWCGPCHKIAPKFAELSTRFPKALFLKVDVDQCTQTAQEQNVSAMPTFIFYRNKVKLDSMRGADPNMLEEKIKSLYSDEEGDDGEAPIKGHMDLSTFINKAASECLNESDDHTYEHALTSKGGYLESDCDEQLIINLGFTQALKLHSMKMLCQNDNGPKSVKLFINQPHTLDFDSASSMEPVQMLELTKDELKDGAVIPLKYVKLQNVTSLTLFVKDNQNGDDTTQIDHLSIIGSPVGTTNMSEFKRVAGKKGESH